MSLPRALAPKDDFVGLESVAHLGAGGETPFLRSHADVLSWFAEQKGAGMAGREAIIDAADAAKNALSSLLGVEAGDIGFGFNVAQAVNMVVHSLPLAAGDNVVMESWEYPSLMYPWLRLRDSGVEVRLVAGEGWEGSAERIAAAVDGRTRAIALSHVSYFTGQRHDLWHYRALADEVGALLLVDASHSLGAVAVDPRPADFLFSCCYKWVLASHGVAVAYWNRERQPSWRPREAGWASVVWQQARERGAPPELVDDGRLFELGNPTFIAACLLGNGVDYIRRLGIDAVEEHVLACSGHLRRGLAKIGVSLLTPESADMRAGNVAFEVGDELAWRRGLEDRGVLGWTSDGRVRLSTHVYNDVGDVDRAVAAVAEVFDLRGGRQEGRAAPAVPR